MKGLFNRWIFTGLLCIISVFGYSSDVSDAIRSLFNDNPEYRNFEIDNQFLLFSAETRNFYLSLNSIPVFVKPNPPAWHTKNIHLEIKKSDSFHEKSENTFYEYSLPGAGCILNGKGCELLEYIRLSFQHGLNPADYHYQLIKYYLIKNVPYLNPAPMDLAKIDILLTDAFFALGNHLYYGRTNSFNPGFNWNLKRKSNVADMTAKLNEALFSTSVSTVLNLQAPRHISYRLLLEELTFFTGLKQKPWPLIPAYVKVKPGESDPFLPVIRQHLINLRYLLADSVSDYYDDKLETQLKLFQADRGVDVDGVVDIETLRALNTSPVKLASQIRVNMERLRWMPYPNHEKYISINIPNFELLMTEGKDTLISMKAVVGKKERPTPVFNAMMTYIVFNPGWTLPPTILQNDVIPELLKGSKYIDKKKMKIYNNNGSEIAYSDIDWSKITANNFPYSVKQEPGAGNSLGKIKFMFPNKESIYIHDTPTKWSFAKSDRTYSSGCIRVEKPFDLAVLLLSDVDGWTADKIKNTLLQNNPQTVRLKTPVEVQIYYLTAWKRKDGRIQFRNDVYHQDEPILKALDKS